MRGIKIGKSRRLTGIEAPTTRRSRQCKLAPTEPFAFSEISTPSAACCLRASPAVQDKCSQASFRKRRCCPAHLLLQTTSSADPSSAVKNTATLQQPPTLVRRASDCCRRRCCCTSCARVCHRLEHLDSAHCFLRSLVRPGDCPPFAFTVFSRYKSTHAQHTLPNLISTTHRRRTYAVLKAIQ
jgi:hypothetical protein